MNIRTIQANELSILSKLYDYNDFDEMISSNKNKILNNTIDIFGLFNDDSKIIGEIRVMYENIDETFAKRNVRAYLYAFRIHEDYQNMGYGKHLINNVLLILENRGYKEFTVGVEDDNYAINIYKKMGFTKFLKKVNEEYQGDKYTYNLYLKD